MQQIKNDIQNLIDAIYDQSHVGGPLCNVLELKDFSDETINRCIRISISNCNDIVMKVLCEKCAELLLQIPYRERYFLC